MRTSRSSFGVSGDFAPTSFKNDAMGTMRPYQSMPYKIKEKGEEKEEKKQASHIPTKQASNIYKSSQAYNQSKYKIQNSQTHSKLEIKSLISLK